MATRIPALPKGVRKTSPWPYAEMPKDRRPSGKATGWVLAISIEPELNGLVTYYPAGTRFPVPLEDRTSPRQILHIADGSLWGKKVTTKPFYRVGTREQAEKFCTVFCSMGRGPRHEKLLPHQEGISWGFNWCSLTETTVRIASQVADHYFNDRYDEAWLVGNAFGDQIQAAMNAAHEAQRVEKG